jgi:hypothetical protein
VPFKCVKHPEADEKAARSFGHRKVLQENINFKIVIILKLS